MSLTQVDIYQIRNIHQARLKPHPHLNIIVGNNGSGKTTLLEAINILTSGNSFRSRETLPLITHGEKELAVCAITEAHQRVNVHKQISGKTRASINAQACKSRSELAKLLPTQIFYQDIFSIMDAGPSLRRTLMDWGVFHVKHDFLFLWKQLKNVVKHRNALLKQRAKPNQFEAWDRQLVEYSEQIDRLRESYFARWEKVFYEILSQLTDREVRLTYRKGWDAKNKGKSLSECLKAQQNSDLAKQYTQSGAHQADITFQNDFKGKAKQTLSRGQQKLVLYALKIAQAKLLEENCLYLCDDLTSELDKAHIERLLKVLSEVKGQVFLTTTSLEHLPPTKSGLKAQVYEIDKGIIQAC